MGLDTFLRVHIFKCYILKNVDVGGNVRFYEPNAALKVRRVTTSLERGLGPMADRWYSSQVIRKYPPYSTPFYNIRTFLFWIFVLYQTNMIHVAINGLIYATPFHIMHQ